MYRLVLCVVGCLSVYAANTTVMLLINHVPIAHFEITLRDMYYNKTKNMDAEFKYLLGDKIDVLCIVSRVVCRVELTYDAEGYPLLDNGLDHKGSYHRGIGLRMELLKEHNHMNLTCKCVISGTAIVTQNVKFILLKTQYTVLLPKINGYLIRPSNSSLIFNHRIVPVYYYDKDLQMNCEGTNDNDVIAIFVYGHRSVKLYSSRHNQLATIKVDDTESIKCEAYDKINNKTTQTLTFDFFQVPFLTYDILPSPTLNLSDSNILLKSYRWRGDELIYYGYDDGDTLTLQCSTNRNKYYYLLNFNGTTLVRTNNTKSIKHIKLSAADDGRILECSLMDAEGELALKTIRVVLKMQQDIRTRIDAITSITKKRWTLRTITAISLKALSTSSEANGIIVIIVIVVSAVTIAIAVAYVIRFVRKKKAASRTNASHLLTEINEDTSTPRVGNQPDACSSLEYAYAYVGNDRAVVGVPQCPPACRGELPRVPDEDSSPEYDYTYGMCKAIVKPLHPCKCRGVAPATQHPRNSDGSDYTDHYTEIDEYFINKQTDRLKRKKENRN